MATIAVPAPGSEGAPPHHNRTFSRRGVEVRSTATRAVSHSLRRLERYRNSFRTSANAHLQPSGIRSYRRQMLPSPPPAYECVASIAEVKTQAIILTGQGEAIRTFLDREEKRSGPFEVSLSPEDDEGTATAILRYGIDVPYRTIGGLVYYAQIAKLRVAGWAFQPPVCEPDKKRP
jgi:hypothetical protein